MSIAVTYCLRQFRSETWARTIVADRTPTRAGKVLSKQKFDDSS